MKRKLLLIIFLLQALLLPAQDFSFVYLPDIHLRPDSLVTSGFEKMVSVVNRLNPDFVLTGGDMIYTAKTVNGQKAKVLFDYMDKEFKLFRMPVKMTMGNHENVGITAESGIDKTNPDWGKQMFERRYHKRYYSFMYNGWKFFILDGIKIREQEKDYTQGIDSEQIEWLRSELRTTGQKTPLVISMHTPFISPENVISSASKVMSPVCDTVLNMFGAHNLRIVLEGHTHRYMNLYYHGIHYLSGGSSEIDTDKSDHGFFQIKLNNEGEDIRFVPLPGPEKAAGFPGTFRVFAVSDMARVFEDGYELPSSCDTLKLFGVRGETLSGQFVVNSKRPLANVTVTMDPLKSGSGNIYPAGSISWNFVGSVPLVKNASNQPLSILTRLAPASFPDYLMDEKQLNINANTYKAIWLTAEIPAALRPGKYSGNITVSSSEGKQVLPLSIEVYPLILPAARHLKVTEWYTTNGFAKFHGINEIYSPEWFNMLRVYAGNMAAHRQNVFQVPMSAIAISKSAEGKLKFDFSRFDQIAQVFWDTKRMDYIETGEPAKFVPGGFSSTAIGLKDFPVKDARTGQSVSIPGEQVLPSLLPAFEEHLHRKGWLDKTLFHIKDEPSHHNALSWIDISSYVHKYAPGLKRIDAVTTSALFGNIEIAVPKLDHFDAGPELYRKGQMNGAELWFYTVGIYQGFRYPNKTIDMPLMDSRILHWLNYAYDLTGYLHWGWNQWNENPYTDVGEHIGDAWHVYPARNGVLNSIRWEQMRNGIQDYECFKMLEDRISRMKDSLGRGFEWIVPEQRGKEIIGPVAYSMKDRTMDPEVLNTAKHKLLREMIDLDVSPKVYIQTNPAEHGTVMNRSVVELTGWAEEGTEITVNGNKLTVNKDGIFMERYIVFVGDKLVIKATKGNEVKMITRDFKVIR